MCTGEAGSFFKARTELSDSPLVKIRASIVGSLFLLTSCGGEDQTTILMESAPGPGMTDQVDSNQTLPPTTQNNSGETDICGAFDAYFDRLFADPDVPRTSEDLFGEDILDPEHPIAKMDDGPFGQAWSSLVADISSQDPSDDGPQIDIEKAPTEIDELSTQQCGYPVVALQAAVVLSCSTNADGVEECYLSGDPRIGYQELQVLRQRVDSFFDAGGVDWLSELPGEEVARRDGPNGQSEMILRVSEEQVPEIGLWIAEFLETNEFNLDRSDIETLRSATFWRQADHRSTYLSLTVVGGLFGDYTYPENPEGVTISVRSLASPAIDPSRGDGLHDLYLIGSELSNGVLSDEEILPIYQDLGPEESLLLISF